LSAAFDDAGIDHIFAALASARGVLLAVSGGPDSVALMRLAARWGAKRSVPIFVATVDHGLRAESRAEAGQVAAWAADLGLPHDILTWDGEKPKTRIQERARAARYDLLLRHAHRVDADTILTAHHADDQAETILFRLLRGSGLGGLAGMQSSAALGDLTHVRPLLGYPKAALIDYCMASGQPFLQDPSNENPVFARTRLRRLAPLLAQEGFDRQSLVRLGRRASRADEALAHCALILRSNLTATRSESHFSGNFRQFAALPEEILLRLLAMEISALCPDRPVRLNRLEALTAAIASALSAGEGLQTTLAGTLLSLDRDGTLTILPEGRRRRGFCTPRAG
jgi:tRNA(Ile)-lysidine synthase